jgi:hypothetical protein
VERILGECEYKENKSVLQEGFWKICELFFLFVVVVVGGDFLPIRVGLGLRVGVLAVKCRRRARRRRRVGGSRGGPFRDEWEPSTARERQPLVPLQPMALCLQKLLGVDPFQSEVLQEGLMEVMAGHSDEGYRMTKSLCGRSWKNIRG